MLKRRNYRLVKYPPDVIKQAYDRFIDFTPNHAKTVHTHIFEIHRPNEELSKVDSDEVFYSIYEEENINYALLRNQHRDGFSEVAFQLRFSMEPTLQNEISIALPNEKEIDLVFDVFEKNFTKFVKQINVFIGHGNNDQWRILKEYIDRFKDVIRVETYESENRVGYHISEVVEVMANKADLALLVHTGENKDIQRNFHARGNVIHETGFLQSKIGCAKSIILLEDGCSEFSNIAGTQQLRFPKDNIRKIFPQILSTINREFYIDLRD